MSRPTESRLTSDLEEARTNYEMYPHITAFSDDYILALEFRVKELEAILKRINDESHNP